MLIYKCHFLKCPLVNFSSILNTLLYFSSFLKFPSFSNSFLQFPLVFYSFPYFPTFSFLYFLKVSYSFLQFLIGFCSFLQHLSLITHISLTHVQYVFLTKTRALYLDPVSKHVLSFFLFDKYSKTIREINVNIENLLFFCEKAKKS